MSECACSCALALLLAAGASCGRLSAPEGGFHAEPPPEVRLPGEPPTLPTLVSAIGASGRVRAEWWPESSALPEHELALFVASSAADVYAGPPQQIGLAGDHLELSGLPDASEWWLGLGLRAVGASAWSPSGALLRARAQAPLFVRLGADPLIADGLTPETAYPDPASALLWTLVLGGGNVWIAEGDYEQQSLPLFPSTCIYGGFEASFDLELRDWKAHPTRLSGAAGQPILACQGGAPGCVIDGLVLDGLHQASYCVDASDTPLVLSRVDARDAADRGLHLRSLLDGPAIDTRLCALRSAGHAADGLSVQGALHLVIDASVFVDNGQEGIDCADLIAPEGGEAWFVLHDSLAARNATDGIDVNLAAPPAGGPTGGRFRIDIAGSRFEDNGAEGAQIDVDYEAQPAWSSEILFEGCRSTANGLNGFHLDLDRATEALLLRCEASANGVDGVLISSESDPGFALVSTGAFHANLGYGLHATAGQRSIVATHCALAGNQLGGASSEPAGSVLVSSAGWLQANASENVSSIASSMSTSPGPAQFLRAPAAYGVVSGASADLLTSSSAAAAQLGQWAETADDGQPRVVWQLGGNQLGLLPAPSTLHLPAALALWPDAFGVTEDWRLALAAPAGGAGLAMPGAAPVDAGPWGAALAGPIGALELVRVAVFRAARAEPPPSSGLGLSQEVRIAFAGGTLDAASASSASVRVTDEAGGELKALVQVLADELVLTPPLEGWPAGFVRVELHSGLHSTEGTGLCATCVLRYAVH